MEREKSPEEIEAQRSLDQRIREQIDKNHLIDDRERIETTFRLLGLGSNNLPVSNYRRAGLNNAIDAIRVVQDYEQAHSDSQWVNAIIENGIEPGIVLKIWDSKDNKAREDKEQRRGKNIL